MITKEQLQAMRDDSRLTQEQAAKMTHCSRSSWEKWEGGFIAVNQANAELFRFKIYLQPIDEELMLKRIRAINESINWRR